MSEESFGKRFKVPINSIPKAHTWLPDGAGIWSVKLRSRRSQWDV